MILDLPSPNDRLQKNSNLRRSVKPGSAPGNGESLKIALHPAVTSQWLLLMEQPIR